MRRWANRSILLLMVVVCLAAVCAFGRAVKAADPVPASVPDDGAIRLIATGDMYLGGWAESTLKQKKESGYFFAGVQPLLSEADVLMGNLECPLSLKGKVYVTKEFTLHASSTMANELKAAGFDYVGLANNHMLDFGPAALQETLQVLDSTGILHSGAGMNLAGARQCAVYTAKGIRFAFLSYSNTYPAEFYAGSSKPGTAPGWTNFVKADIKAAHEQADIVIVSFHWGAERTNYPVAYQMELARASIDSGADLIVGNHPHVLQGIQIYNGKVIAYSLGNFVFGSYSSSKIRDSVLLEVRFRDKNIDQVKLYPINVDNRVVQFRPALYDATNAARVLGDMRTYSAKWGTPIVNENGVGVIRLN